MEELTPTPTPISTPIPSQIPENFSTIINDFINDILITFPECAGTIDLFWSKDAKDVEKVFKHCLKIYPERFFDILYKNEEIFKTDSTVSTEFLPYIIFKHLWKCEITEKTKDSIWKYLQLILFSIINCVKDIESFGNTANLFNSIDEGDFKSKLHETLTSVQNAFNTTSDVTGSTTTDSTTTGSTTTDAMPNANDIHNHMNGMLNGKLGNLAKEIAEETADSLDIDFNNITNVQDIFQSLFKNPAKLMNIVKSVGDKLDSRIKSGNIDETELMSEATEIMNNMKNMPGLENMQEMLAKMGMGGLSGLVGKPTAPAPTTRPVKPAKAKPKKVVNLQDLQAQQKQLTQQHEEDMRLNKILNDEQLVAMFNKPTKSKKKKE